MKEFQGHPGEVLRVRIKEAGITATQLARDLHVPANRICQILSGMRSITADTALRLGRYFGTDPHVWTDIQVAYELSVARRKLEGQIENIRPRCR